MDTFTQVTYGRHEDDEAKQCADIPPAVNVKCIVFTLVLTTGYWFLPPKNKWVLLALLYFPYAAMAWYDYRYACERNLGPTYLALFYWWVKPYDSEQIRAYRNWCPKHKRRVLVVDVLLLLVVIALVWPFLRWNP